MEKIVKGMASDEKKIGEHSAEYWLDILNRNTEHTIGITYTKKLKYEKLDYFFVSGQLSQMVYNDDPRSVGYHKLHNAFFLIAVGRPAVQVLADQEHLFRQISGSEELAAFSIYRWAEFTDALIRKGHSKPVL